MKSFLTSFLVSLLLISNGMLTAVIDVCCTQHSISESLEEVSCCASKKAITAHHCCENDSNEETLTHESCKFGSWYYYTAKYFEETNQKSKLDFFTNPSNISFKFSIDKRTHVKCLLSGVDHPPPFFNGRIVLERFSVWII